MAGIELKTINVSDCDDCPFSDCYSEECNHPENKHGDFLGCPLKDVPALVKLKDKSPRA